MQRLSIGSAVSFVGCWLQLLAQQPHRRGSLRPSAALPVFRRRIRYGCQAVHSWFVCYLGSSNDSNCFLRCAGYSFFAPLESTIYHLYSRAHRPTAFQLLLAADSRDLPAVGHAKKKGSVSLAALNARQKALSQIRARSLLSSAYPKHLMEGLSATEKDDVTLYSKVGEKYGLGKLIWKFNKRILSCVNQARFESLKNLKNIAAFHSRAAKFFSGIGRSSYLHAVSVTVAPAASHSLRVIPPSLSGRKDGRQMMSWWRLPC